MFNTSLGKKIVVKTNEAINIGDTIITDNGDTYVVKGLSFPHDPQDDRISISI
jgi:hypothetical protein